MRKLTPEQLAWFYEEGTRAYDPEMTVSDQIDFHEISIDIATKGKTPDAVESVVQNYIDSRPRLSWKRKMYLVNLCNGIRAIWQAPESRNEFQAIRDKRHAALSMRVKAGQTRARAEGKQIGGTRKPRP